MERNVPTLEPPEDKVSFTSGETGATVPSPLPPQRENLTQGSAVAPAPTLTPAAVAEAAVGAWNTNKRVDALWTIRQNRNVYVGITGVGWKKLSTASDSAITALTLLLSCARANQSPVTYRDEADGMIHETYVW